MHFKQHVPNFVEGVNPVEFDFATQEELLEHPQVKAWSQDDYTGRGPFFRYSLCFYGQQEFLLMVEYSDGKDWRVIGYIDGATPGPLTLPRWEPKQEVNRP
jgi:hypothetical protein